jgi:uncharacterized membrane protein YebE (DUF533 family)
MAKKLGRLAGLAALAGAAYMMREKFGKDKDAKALRNCGQKKKPLMLAQKRKKTLCLVIKQLN